MIFKNPNYEKNEKKRKISKGIKSISCLFAGIAGAYLGLASLTYAPVEKEVLNVPNVEQTLEDIVEKNSNKEPIIIYLNDVKNTPSEKEPLTLIDMIKSTEYNDETMKTYTDLIQKFPKLYSTAYNIAKDSDIDPALLMGLVTIEGGIQMKYSFGDYENGNELKISNGLNLPVKGVAQISKATWETYGKDFSWEDMDKYEPNMIVAIRVLKSYYDAFEDLGDALVAYNLGIGKAKNVKEKYANGNKGEIADTLERWVKQGFEEYEASAYFPWRVLKTTDNFRKVLEEAGAYDEDVKKIPQEYLNKLLNDLPSNGYKDPLVL